MNTRYRFAILSLSVLALAACASTDERTAVAPQGHSGYVQDSEYIATVEYLARRRGTEVVWVNPPKRQVGDDD